MINVESISYWLLQLVEYEKMRCAHNETAPTHPVRTVSYRAIVQLTAPRDGCEYIPVSRIYLQTLHGQEFMIYSPRISINISTKTV